MRARRSVPSWRRWLLQTVGEVLIVLGIALTAIATVALLTALGMWGGMGQP